MICKVGNVEGGDLLRIVIRSEAVLRRWSFRDISGTGTVEGRKVTVSVIRVALVEGM